MSANETPRVGYVVKRYPRYSETFIVNEILAHEATGLPIEIFALRPPSDTHFQNRISQVRAPVTYIPHGGVKAGALWSTLRDLSNVLPDVFATLPAFLDQHVLDVYQALLLAREVRERRIGHLHAHFGTVSTTVARMAARFADVPYTFTAHAKDIFHEDVDHKDFESKARDSAAVVTVSDFNERFLRQQFPDSAEKVRRVYNGVDLSRFSYESPEDRPPRIVAVGRLVEKKGFDDLINACSLLVRDGERFECQIIGEGEKKNELRRQIEQLDLDDHVELAGPRPQRDVIHLIQQASVVAVPCVLGHDGNRDGLPTILLEAMALGTPCVSTDVTGIPEVVIDDVTGLMVPERDPRSLAEAIKKLLDDAQLRVRLAEAARELIQNEFDIDRNAGQLRELFISDHVISVESASACS